MSNTPNQPSDNPELGPEFFILQNFSPTNQTRNTVSKSDSQNSKYGELQAKLLNPSNAYFVNGETSHLIRTRTQLWYAVILLAGFAIFFGILTGPKELQYLQLQQSGIKTSAIIIERQTLNFNNGGINYYLTYSYSTGRAAPTYTHQVQVFPSTYNNLSEGSTVIITYLADTPDYSHIAGDDYENQNSFLTLLGLGIPCLLALSFALLILQERDLYKRLERDGRILKGQVTRVGVRSQRVALVPLSKSVTILYRFYSPNENLLKGKCNFIHYSGLIPSIGSFVNVFYADDKHHTLL